MTRIERNDVESVAIVRMRGRIVEVKDGKVTLKSGSKIPGVSGATFVELVNVEVNGRYWLPATERTEFQAAAELFGTDPVIVPWNSTASSRNRVS